jgi:2,4'-dihydroxyacetophenone dioxygenase
MPPNLGELLITADELEWREKSLPGLAETRLWSDAETGASIALVRFREGSGIPEPHSHASNQFMYCLSGRYEYLSSDLVLEPGAFYVNPKGHVHGPTVAREETVLLEIYDGPHYPQRPSWYSNDDDAC